MLINLTKEKFDPDYEENKRKSFKDLESKNILKENIFPIASIYAYYVTLARIELNTKDKLDIKLDWG